MRSALGPGRRRAALVAVLAAEIALSLFALLAPAPRLERLGPLRTSVLWDFVAFDCAGTVLRERRDPYLDRPLRRCEAAVSGDAAAARDHVLPAPVPPYDLPLFEAISTLQPRRAEFFWLGTLVVSALAAAILFEPVLGVPALLIAGLFFLGAGRDDFLLGQPPPLMLLATACATISLRRERYAAAAIAASAGMIEPHLGLPGCVSLFALVPRCRVPLAACAGALLLLGLASVGVGPCVEYATKVLPAQVLAEVPNAFQYSTTFALAVLHVPDQAAYRIGSLWYLATIALGVSLARGLARRFGDDAFVTTFPVVAAVLGGSYLHEQHLVALVPGAFLLVRHLRRNVALPVAAIVASLAWEPAYLGVPMYSLVTLLALGVALAIESDLSRATRIVAALGVALVYIGLTEIDHALEARVVYRAPPASTFASEAAWAREYPEYTWGLDVRRERVYDELTAGHAISKLPTWFGLVTILAIARAATRRPATLEAAG